MLTMTCLVLGGLYGRHRLAVREALPEIRRLGGRVPGGTDGPWEIDLSGWFVSDDDLSGLIARLLPTNGPIALNLSRTKIRPAGRAARIRRKATLPRQRIGAKPL
jgi:hypothetical protein